MLKKIAQGAEAKIFLEDEMIIKERTVKNYRIKEIDDRLRKSRTKREAKLIEKLGLIGVNAPKLLKTDNEQKIEMEFIKGEMIKNILDKNNYEKLCKEIGEGVALMHENDVVHADLTTSNMILNDKDKKIYFIDFGLSFFSAKIEDKAVDLHLLRQALESKHYKIWEECFKEVLKGYEKYTLSKEVFKRLEQVEKRGRNKGKK